MEQWRDVVGYEGFYQVSNLGNVRRIKQSIGTRVGRVLRPQNRGGYFRVRLYKDTQQWKTVHVHRLVAEAFLGIPLLPLELNHKDGNPKNNCVENLEWVTRSENLIHSIRVLHRQVKHGELSPNAKFSNSDAAEIRRLYARKTMNQVQLANRFGVSQTTIWRIINYRSWNIPQNQ